jgi:predicted amidophosphoribosyltransferase
MTSLVRKLTAQKVAAPPDRTCRDCGSDVPSAKTRCGHCGGANIEDVDPTRPPPENFFVGTIGAEVNNIRRPDA